ncbi:manganese efflux pump MntP family protein [bacterium]|nr:manganese efflux pump MntP family protein [bacterium]
MELLTILALAVALAMDAFAVSVAAGIRLGCVTGGQTFRLASHFGFFQFLMPVLGWSLGASMEKVISSFDHWIAMLLLGFIGGKMIYEALVKSDTSKLPSDPTRGFHLYGLSVATSIDALAVGISLGVLNRNIWYPSIIIGIVAAAFTVVGIRLGCRIGLRFSKNMEILGGIILIAIGVKIVLDHTVFAS